MQVSIAKIIGLVVGAELQDNDKLPVQVEGGSLEMVDSLVLTFRVMGRLKMKWPAGLLRHVELLNV